MALETRFLVSEAALSLEPALEFLRRPGWGAQAFFSGSVRTPNQGKEVQYLEYEAYAPMCEQVLHTLALEASGRWPIAGVYVAHRTGRLYPAELSIVIGVGSPHRRAALEACDFLIERIKQVLPVWKLERTTDGEAWVEGNTGFEAL